jgi:hypothetical protein
MKSLRLVTLALLAVLLVSAQLTPVHAGETSPASRVGLKTGNTLTYLTVTEAEQVNLTANDLLTITSINDTGAVASLYYSSYTVVSTNGTTVQGGNTTTAEIGFFNPYNASTFGPSPFSLFMYSGVPPGSDNFSFYFRGYREDKYVMNFTITREYITFHSQNVTIDHIRAYVMSVAKSFLGTPLIRFWLDDNYATNSGVLVSGYIRTEFGTANRTESYELQSTNFNLNQLPGGASLPYSYFVVGGIIIVAVAAASYSLRGKPNAAKRNR